MSPAYRACAPGLVVSADLGDAAESWNRLAVATKSPFMTHEWLTCWWRAFGRATPTWILAHDSNGALRAGAFVQRWSRTVAAAANVHSGDWDVIAEDDHARRTIWEALAALRPDRIRCPSLPAWGDTARIARETFGGSGYRVVTQPGGQSPWLELPRTWSELLDRQSRGLRSQLGRKKRAMERSGSLQLRCVTDGPTVERDLDTFLELEASGWKGRSGTAILCDAKTERLYREFAYAAAAKGWLRLYLLELDGRAIAGDYGCALAGAGSLIKTGFSEDHARLSPGFVLRGDVLRASVEEGLGAYYFHGGADEYKLRWTPQVRPHSALWAYRGLCAPAYTYRRALRPILKSVHARTVGAAHFGRGSRPSKVR